MADIGVFAMRQGVFAFKDAWAKKMLRRQKLECLVTVRNGRIVFDQEGFSRPDWKTEVVQ